MLSAYSTKGPNNFFHPSGWTLNLTRTGLPINSRKFVCCRDKFPQIYLVPVNRDARSLKKRCDIYTSLPIQQFQLFSFLFFSFLLDQWISEFWLVEERKGPRGPRPNFYSRRANRLRLAFHWAVRIKLGRTRTGLCQCPRSTSCGPKPRTPIVQDHSW
jgi:hypothetical protein